MPRNGSGTYSLPQAAFVIGTPISSSAMNSDLSDIAQGLTDSVARDGQTAMVGPLNMGGFAITGASNATLTGVLTVGGATALNGATTVNNTTALNGATTVNNTATLNGATTINNTLAVTGEATFTATNGPSVTHAGTGFTVKQSGVGAVTGIDVSTSNVAGPIGVFRYVAAIVGSISTDGVNCFYNNLSDERLKQPEGPLTDVGGIVDAVTPQWFRWLATPDRPPQPGFLAQEVHRHYPWAVTPGHDDVPWQMDASKLLPVVWAEMQALRRRVAALEAV